MKGLRKHLKQVTVLGALLAVLSAAPELVFAQGGLKHHFSVTDDAGNPITSGRCRFLTAGANTNLTLYTDRTLATTKANPTTIDTTLGVCEAFLPDATDVIDVIVYVDGGSHKGAVQRADAVGRTTSKRIIVNGSSGMKHLAVPFSTASASRQTSTLGIPKGALVNQVIVETTLAVASSTAMFSTADSGAGVSDARYCNAVSTAAVGFAACSPGVYLIADSSALFVFHNTNHETAGFFHVYYHLPANEP